MQKMLIILGIILLNGCATNNYSKGNLYSGPVDTHPKKATVYLFRPHSTVGALREYNLMVNKEVKATLPNGTYATIYLEPGVYSFGAQIVETWHGDGPYIETTYEVEPGKEYFVGYFKRFPLSSNKNDNFFLKSEASKVYSPILEGGVLDADHQIGIVNRKYAIPELEKLSIVIQK